MPPVMTRSIANAVLSQNAHFVFVAPKVIDGMQTSLFTICDGDTDDVLASIDVFGFTLKVLFDFSTVSLPEGIDDSRGVPVVSFVSNDC